MNAFANDSFTVWHREWLRFIRKPARVVGSFLTPIIWMAMFGYGMQRGLQVKLPFPGFEGTYLDWTAPGIVVMGMLFTGIFTGMAILFDRQFGFLKEILVAPVSRVSFVVGKGLGGMTASLVQGVTMLVLAVLVFRVPVIGPFGFAGGFLLAVVALGLLGLGIVNLGVAIAARLESHEVFMLVANFLVMPLFFLSGALYPLNNLPTALQAAIHVNPVHYGVDALRWALFGASGTANALALDLGVLVLFALLTTLLAARLFSRS
jgi:ABC-2 type transport system permease protein